MAFTEQDRYYHDFYEVLDDDTREVVDSVFYDLQNELRSHGVFAANDDRAECLVAAITRYVLEGKK